MKWKSIIKNLSLISDFCYNTFYKKKRENLHKDNTNLRYVKVKN